MLLNLCSLGATAMGWVGSYNLIMAISATLFKNDKMGKYSKNTSWGILRDAQENIEKIPPGRANSPQKIPEK